MAEKWPDSAVHPRQSAHDGDGDLLSSLTPRERDVLDVYLQLLNDKKVARFLSIRPQTVRNHLASIEHKLGVQGREALISLVLSRRSDA